MNFASSSIERFVGCIVTLTVIPSVVAGSNLVMANEIAQSPSSIVGSWRLVNMTEGNTPTPMVPPQNVELTAEFSGDRISGSGGCNRFFGGYQTTEDKLSITTLGSTRKACQETILAQEAKYLSALQGAQRYETDSQGRLEIFYQTERGAGVLRFTSQNVRGLW
jgi:heat shock protein HslJ